MLRTSRICNSGLVQSAKIIGNRRVAGTVLKRHESTAAAEPKKSGSIVGKLAGATFVGTAAYGGAVYYATQDEQFRDTLKTYLPGGKQALEFIEDLQKNQDLHNYRGQAADIQKQAGEYVDIAKEYGSKAINSSKEAYEYVNDAYLKLSGQKELPRLPDIVHSKPEEAHIVSNEPVIAEISVTSEKEETAPVVQVAIVKPDPIVVKMIKSENAIVRELSQIVTELAAILNDAGLASKGRDVVKDAEQQLENLNKRYAALDVEQDAVLNAIAQLRQLGDKVDTDVDEFRLAAKNAIQTTQSETVTKIEAKVAELQDQFENAQVEMKAKFTTALADQLNGQKERLQRERMDALGAQADEMQRQFISKVKLLVEQERAGRLSKLERISERYKAMEQQSIRNADELDKSRQYHLMYVTLGALQDAVEAPQKQPFVQELEALRNSAKDNAVLKAVLSSIPREVAEEGIESANGLSVRFEQIAEQARRVALVPEDGGFGAHILSIILSKLLFRKEGLVQGDDVEAVLARSGYYLKNGDLELAVRELNQLRGWPKRLAYDWIESARRHLEIKQALEVVESQIVLSSMLDA
ncbi:Formation of crista junctions protein 1 [Apophysomyces sp. BC1034]|nr:Formation of crista junctions protein 1 [Apophysomyces sp. BC1021]KAG0192490.1 Formation of crista junctions protein 1 [Apophysomyces sp. BC1034]